MRLGSYSLALVVGLLASASGCQFFFPTPIEQQGSQSTTPPKVMRAVGAPFRAGEVLKGDVYLDSIRAGSGELRVTEACDAHGKPAVLVTFKAASSGLARMLKSADATGECLLDADSGAPLTATADTRIGDEDTQTSTIYAPSKYMFRQTRIVDLGYGPFTRVNVDSLSIPIEQVPHNGDSFLGYVRNWKPPPGTDAYTFLVIGRFVWRADLTFVGPEMISTSRGEEKALRIDGVGQKLVGREVKELAPSATTPKRPFSMWISDDDRHAPLRVLLETDLAKISVELSSYAIEPVKGDPHAACKPLFDGDVLEHEATVAAQQPRPHRLELMLPKGAPPEAKKLGDYDDDDKDEQDGIQKILKVQE